MTALSNKENHQHKPWLNHYPNSVAKELKEIKHTNLVEFYDDVCEKYADQPAFNSLDTQLTYRQVQRLSKQLASWLKNNYDAGTKVALIAPNCLSYPIIVQAIHRANMVAVNINPLLTSRELGDILKNSEATVAFIWDGAAHRLENVDPSLRKQINAVVIVKLSDYFPILKGRLIDFALTYVKKLIPSYSLKKYSKVYRLKEVNQGSEIIDKAPQQHNDLAFLQYTGGTTGRSKGIILSHGNILSNMMQISQYLSPNVLKSKVAFAPLPLYHIFALSANLYVLFGLGIKNILISNPRDLPTFINTLKKHPPHIMIGVNTLFNALINHPNINEVDFSNLTIALGGGMSVQKNTSDEWLAITGSFIIEAYGLSETSPALTINPYNINEFNSSVGLPLPATEIMIIDENNHAVGVNEAGELCVKGPQVTQGYWKNKQENEQAFTPDGWFKTGDIVRMDEKGYIYILDRKKDIIVVSGFNVYPIEIEQIIHQMEEVFECGCIGVLDANTNEAVKAFVITKENASITEKDIVTYCKKYLTAYKVPKYIEFVEEIPHTTVGKVSKVQLRKQQDDESN